MALILAVESSARFCSVALHRAGQLVSDIKVQQIRSAAAALAPSIKELFQQCGLNIEGIDAVSVSAGPGSYTGLRIASSTAKGICLALGKPLIALNTLEIMDRMVQDRAVAKKFCPMLDARRSEVYSMIVDQDHSTVSRVQNLILDENSFKQELEEGRVLFFGDGSEKWRKLCVHPNAVFQSDVEPMASAMGELGWKSFSEKRFESVIQFEPHYLKAFVAGPPRKAD